MAGRDRLAAASARRRAETLAQRLAGALGRRPIAVSVALLATLAGLRTVDVVVLELHRWPGTLAPSALAMLAVGVALATRMSGPATLRLDGASVRRALLVGVLATGAVQVAARGLELLVLALRNAGPILVVRAENPATATADPTEVGAYLLFGVVVTAVGEELFFRRVVLDSLSGRYGFWRANAGQAALFGLWHFAWPLAYLLSPSQPYPPLAVYAVGLLAVTSTVGLLYGWLVKSMGSLWTAVAAHLLHNLSAVVVHVRTGGGDVRGSFVAAGVLVGYLVVALWARRRFGGDS